MRGSIDFNDEPRSNASEVSDVRAHRVLATKSRAIERALAKVNPKDHFGLCHRLTETLRVRTGLSLTFAHNQPPNAPPYMLTRLRGSCQRAQRDD
jgi:hypothetical protein